MDIPHDELSSYLSADLHATQELSDAINIRLNSKPDAALKEPVVMSNSVALTLARIYQRGFKVNQSELAKVKKEFEDEKQELESALDEQVSELM